MVKTGTFPARAPLRRGATEMAKAIAATMGAIAALLACASARADDQPYGQLSPFNPVEEVRGGLFVDDAVGREAHAPMATFQLLSSPLALYPTANPWLAPLFAPRLEAGAMINGLGLTSYAFAGLNWREPLWGPLFLEVGFGGAANDSARTPYDSRKTDLGCPVTFRESGGLGWRFNDHFDAVTSIEHISHAQLCGRLNPGLTSVGLRFGYHF